MGIEGTYLNIIKAIYDKPKGFPDSSTGKESACNTEDFGSIPRLGRFPGERIGYPPQYYQASLVSQR